MPLILLLSLLLTSCASEPDTGAIQAPLELADITPTVGHYTEAILAETASGTILAFVLSNEMDKYDREQLNHVYERGVSRQTNAWRNQATGKSYRITPQPKYSDPASGRPCRHAQIKTSIHERPQTIHTSACRNEQWQWQVQNI